MRSPTSFRFIRRLASGFVALAGLALAVRSHAADAPAPPPTATELHTVTATPLDEEVRVGANQQPEWTKHHRFSDVEIYVLAPWEFSTELGWDASVPDEGDATHAVRQEFELGLPWHSQIDYVLREESTEEDGFEVVGHSIEGSVALADWGTIPLNPAVLFEYTFGVHEPDELEAKLLLGAELAPRWHWGLNFAFEQQTGGDREREIVGSQALGYSFLDQRLSVGAELTIGAEEEAEDEESKDARAAQSDAAEEPGEEEDEWEVVATLGPSVQWRITDELHLAVATLFGLTEASPLVNTFVSIAYTWDFDDASKTPSAEEQRFEPLSNQHR
ncbi:MAG: hypothetical protein U0610_26105 [bacterium]